MSKQRNARVTIVGSGVLAAALFWGSASYGQSLGEVARQERERRKLEPNQATHVYTNDELKKAQILVPADRQRVLDARRSLSAPEIQAKAAAVPSLPLPAAVPPASDSELAFAQDALELEAILSAPRPAKFVAHRVNVVNLPKIQHQDAPALPVVAALLPPVPAQMIEHIGINQAVAVARTEKTTPAQPTFAVLDAPVLPVAAALQPPPMPAQMNEGLGTSQSVTLVREEKAALAEPMLAVLRVPALPVAASAHSPAAPTQNFGVHQVRPASTPARAEHRGAPANVSLASASEPSASLMPHQAAARPELRQTVTLIDFEKTAPHGAAGSSSANLPLAARETDQLTHHRTHQLAQQLARRRASARVVAVAKKILASRRGSNQDPSNFDASVVHVGRGDSLWRLARLHLGSGARWRELAELNPEISDPGLIHVGDVIRLPNA